MKKDTTVCIVGGGVSGLACARVLHDADIDFRLITKEIGGRIHAETAGGEVPHGTAYVTEDYHHMLQFVDLGSAGKQSPKHFYFFDDSEFVHPIRWKHLKYLPALLRFKKILKKFRKHILDYRKAMEEKSLKEIFEQDEFLHYTWKTPASKFIKQYGLEDLDRIFVNPIVATTTFAESDEINTAYYLGMSLPLVSKTWRADFTHAIERLTDGVHDNISIGEVTGVVKSEDAKHKIESTAGEFTAEYVVFAAPERQIGHLYPGIPKPHKQLPFHTLNVQGVRKGQYKNKPVVFLRSRLHNGLYSLFQLGPGVDLVYSRDSQPDLSDYYEEYTIRREVAWDPAMIVPDHNLIGQVIDDHAYLASDYNISGLEDAYVSGLSVGKRIVRELQK